MTPELGHLTKPSHTVLILQEVQEGVVGSGAALKELAAAAKQIGLLDHTRRLTQAARAAGVRVVHCTAEHLHGGFGANHNARLFSAARRLGVIDEAGNPSVAPAADVFEEGDIVLPRYHGLSPLTGTQLDSLLRNEGIKTLVVTGVSLNIAIPNLVFDAVHRSYQVVIPRDAVAGVPLEYGEQVLALTLRPLATVVTSDELVSVWSDWQ
jgi:nicotinamidase-related amidase